jgi:hypothetical protein
VNFNVWSYYSTDHGATFGAMDVGGLSSWHPEVRIHPAAGDTWYANSRPSGGAVYELQRLTTAGTYTNLMAGIANGPFATAGGIWPDPTDANHLLIAARATNTRIIVSQDAGATAASDALTSVVNMHEIGDGCDEYYWVQGCTSPSSSEAPLYVSTDGVTLTAKSGTNYNTSPYTDAIPVTCGGISKRGIWVVGAGAGHIRFHSVASDMAVTVPEPHWGDRSAWRVTDYDTRHADDIHGAALQRHLPLPGAAGGLARSDGTDWQRVDALAHSELSGVTSDQHHTRAHNLDSATDHPDVDNTDKADGRVLVWRSMVGNHVYEEMAAGAAPATAAAGYATSVGDGVAVTYTVTHSLNTYDVLVQVYDTADTPTEQVGATVEIIDADNVRVTFLSAPSANQYRVLVVSADSVAPHDAVTLDANADTVLSLTDQAIGLDTQTANTVLAGPVTGADAVPTFRALASTDLGTGTPDGTRYLRDDLTWQEVSGGAATVDAVAAVALIAGDLVQLYDNAGTLTCRPADASLGREACGYVDAAYSPTETATVYLDGTNAYLTGLTVAATLYLHTAGDVTETPPTTAGHMYQEVGQVLSATSAVFRPQHSILLA